ncbi:hypothetical protein [uncultured Cohaesibacter sp.]|uniref:hypothetical protein n=1 Tax=uncultured Cohaesibacter sp. TaxID=1002546 RepID=UPI0029C86BD9|nr:hypothetical protein [uncultured Cohaesibacter sp.]
MKSAKKLIISILPLIMLTACVPAKISGQKPDGTKIRLLFYPGGPKLKDLVIFEEQVYFGKVEELTNEPANDISFTLENGKRFIAECTAVQVDKTNSPKCMEYDIYHSEDEAIPENTVFYRPRWY